MNAEDFIKSQLCLQAYRDAAVDGLNGMLAVCFCLRYRQRAGWFGGDWLQILAHHRDYAAVNAPPQFDLPDPRNYAFGLLIQEIDGIFSGRREDDILAPNKLFSGGLVGQMDHSFAQPSPPPALYYGRLSDPEIRDWFLDNISRATDKHSLIATVGSLSFFS